MTSVTIAVPPLPPALYSPTGRGSKYTYNAMTDEVTLLTGMRVSPG